MNKYEQLLSTTPKITCIEIKPCQYSRISHLASRPMPFIHQDSLPSKEIFPGYVAKMIHTESMTLVYWSIAAGAAIPEHSHVHEQVTHVLEGSFELVVDGEACMLELGIVTVIPSNVKHYGHAVTDCLMIDVFSPVRQDYVARMENED